MPLRPTTLVALVTLLVAQRSSTQDVAPGTSEVTTLADDQEGTITVYAVGPAAESTVGGLLTRSSNSEFFQLSRPTACQEAVPVEPRNPFLLLEEQEAGKSRAEILEASAFAAAAQQSLTIEREREQVVQVNSTVLSDAERERSARLAALRTRIDGLRLSALLIGPSGSSALLNGNVVRAGDPILDDSLRIESISFEGARVACGEEILLISLAPVTAARTNANPNAVDPPATEPAPSAVSTNEGAENP